MIVDKEITINISHLNINYYKELGYDVKCNNKITIPIEHLQKQSNLKIEAICDICGSQKFINYQKYNKNIEKYNLYTCVKCSSIKNRMTYKEKFGVENYVNVVALRKIVKEKYDRITQEIENKGLINCIKCSKDKKIDEFLIKNGRYKHICRLCRNTINKVNKKKRLEEFPELEKEKEKLNYKKNIHIYLWRNTLKNYLNRKGLRKYDSSLNLLKYSHFELKMHLECLFNNNMSWDNYGLWQIDHIIHVSFFKEDTPIHIVNSLENLRPFYNNSSRQNKIDDDLLKILPLYRIYIKDNFLKQIDSKII